jgi:hypothetical protein
MGDERALHGMRFLAVGETRGRDDLRSLVRYRQRQAAVDAATVEQHRARSALAVVTSLLGAGNP